MAPAEDFLAQGKADLFPEQQGDDLVMEATDTMESTIRGCTSFGHQDMDAGMEVDVVAKSLDHGHYSRHKLKACGCMEFLPPSAINTAAERHSTEVGRLCHLQIGLQPITSILM